MLTSLDPIAAVTHPDPYPYYAELVARKPIYHDETLGIWVASSADAVTAVLKSDLCRVRPANEVIPRALLGSPAADIFGQLVRMTDGPGHCPLKKIVSETLNSLDRTQVSKLGIELAPLLSEQINLMSGSNRLTDFAFQLPTYVVASLLGVPRGKLPQVASLMSDFVRCIAPNSNPEQIERGKVAAGQLFDMFRLMLMDQQWETTNGLLGRLGREAERLGQIDPNTITDTIIANGIGFLSQGYEATAGLIGNTLVVLSSHREVYEQVQEAPSLLPQVINEVLRYDSPAQNTRRFVARDGMVAGQEMKAGDMILVILAAANRDQSVKPEPERFDLFRKEPQIYSIGLGLHACPGAVIATENAAVAVQYLLASDVISARLLERMTYRASGNTRIPVWS
jgi:cytochrome P450